MSTEIRPAASPDEPQAPCPPTCASVLVADDDEASRYMLERALGSLGQRIVLVETGEEALELAAQQDFAAIVLDIGLPGASGFEVARALKRQERSQHTPLLFVTGQQYTEALVTQAYATGASDLLTKPFNPDVLNTKLRVFVDLYLQRQHLEAQRRELLARTRALEESRHSLSESRESLGRTSAEHARLHALFSQAPLAIAILRGPRLMIELANPLACRIWGRPLEELLGRSFLEAPPSPDAAVAIPILQRVFDTGIAYVGKELPLRLVRYEEGAPEDTYFSLVYEPMRDGEGRVEGIIAVASEVTDGVRARRRAESVQAELEAIFESIPDAAYVGDLSGIKRANRKALDMLGYSDMEDLNVHISELASRVRVRQADTGELVPPEHTGFVRALAGESEARDYLVYNAALARDVRVRSAANPVRIGGKVAAAVVVNTDITERHAVEESLRRSEEELRTLADSIPQAVWTTSADGALTYANSAMVHYTGLRLEELLGTGFLRMISPDTREQATGLMARYLGEGEPYECEMCWLRLDGAMRWHLVRVVPLKSSSGMVMRWLGTATDVHDLRQSQSETQRRADFEQQLIGIVSHDLRNPLSAILLGVTALARREGLDDRSRKSLLRIQSSAERAVRMIRDLLDFTQARLGGGIPLKRQRADLHLVTRSVLEEVEATNPGREVVTRYSGDGQGEWDADRIAQVIQNLVTNALKYSPPDTQVRVEAVGEDGGVTLSVHNLGEPIPSERGGSLFEPLQRATADVDQAGRSVGLGLYIVDQIVRAHGGSVSMRSSASEGTSFIVKLPRATDSSSR
ncbi:PAS domain-containing protein [Melittangium boletus]|uniref:histidine kinase n=1 Tax=Melittangium boletus DSM 14713 TaxID=1294270 RepID=A0A250IIG4_9BACT|nr:PAS domain-containing protein [Melittangium boletus]ATB31023.1 two-component system sensor histidine kinase/response regulator [Melittangium boletus DSM 14713]